MGDSTKLDHLLDEVVTLPSLPSTVARITGLINDPNSTLPEIGKAIATDTSLALKTLRLVNSAYYGVREKVNTVEQAVVLLGIKVINNLVFTATVFETFQFSEERLLRHSIACGITMKNLVESGLVPGVNIEHSQEAFTLGLLHDVGKIIFQQFLADDMRNVMHVCGSRELSSVEGELEVIGADHAEIGARLARNWKLSEEIVDTIAGHHDLSKCTNSEYRDAAALLAVADYICYQADMPAHDSVPMRIDQEMWETTQLCPETVQPAVDQLLESARDVDELLSLAS